MKGLLSIDQGLSVLSKVPIKLQKEIFLVNEDFQWKRLVLALFEAAEESPDGLAAGVLVSSPYTIMIGATSERQIYVVDSHSHSHYGALVAASGSSSFGDITTYLSEYFKKQFKLSDSITLQTGHVIRREFHFGLLSL